MVGVDRVVYGTNFGGAYDNGDLTAGLGLSDADVTKIRSGNACRLLKIDAHGARPVKTSKTSRRHIDLAKRLDKTLVIHDRDAHAEVLQVIESGQPQTFELMPQEITQLKTQLAGSPYWLLGGKA